MRVAVVQFAAGTEVSENLDEIGRLVREAGGGGPELIVLPEGSMHDFGPPDLPLGPVAQPLDGPFVSGLAELARATGANIAAGMFERSPDPARPFNTVVVVSPHGEVLASYRKTHLYDSFGYRESDRLLAGDPQPVVLPLGEFMLGLMTCYDLRFPEFARLLVDAGADTLVVPAAWVRGSLKEDHWVTLLRARAIENTVYVVGAAQNGATYCGNSVVVDPMGVRVASLGEESGVAWCELSKGRLEAVRRRNPSLANRRLKG